MQRGRSPCTAPQAVQVLLSTRLGQEWMCRHHRVMTSSHAIRYGGEDGQSRYLAGGATGFKCNYLPVVKEENTRVALAFWREGMRPLRIHDGYSFLSFFKVMESQFTNGNHRGRWIDEALPTLIDDAAVRIGELSELGISVGTHLYESGASPERLVGSLRTKPTFTSNLIACIGR